MEPTNSEGLKMILMWVFFPLKHIHLKIKLKLWWVHSCALLLLWTREGFSSKATEWVPVFKPFMAGKFLCALEQTFILCLGSWKNASFFLHFNCFVSSNRSCTKSLPRLAIQKLFQKENWNISEKRTLYGMEMQCGIPHCTRTVGICSFAKVTLTGENWKPTKWHDSRPWKSHIA